MRVTRKTITALADRLPAQTAAPDTCPSIRTTSCTLAAFSEVTGPLRARGMCEALGHELPPKNLEGTRAKPKRPVRLDVLAEADAGSFSRKQ